MDAAHADLEQENDFAIALELSLQDQAAHTNDTQNLRSLKSSVEEIIKNEEDDAAIAQAMQQQDILTSESSTSNRKDLDKVIMSLVSDVKKSFFIPKVVSFRRRRKDVDAEGARIIAAEKRLLERLKSYGLGELKVSGNGNCQFSSLSDQLYRTPKMHKVVRKMVLAQLQEYPHLYSKFVPENYEEYCDIMSYNGEWGDHVTLQAAADKFGAQINLITSYEDTICMEILPNERKVDRILWLSFLAEYHYNSVYPIEELERRKKEDRCVIS